jgi:hypothetical protein
MPETNLWRSIPGLAAYLELYLKHQITFLKYLKLILHEHRVDVTQYQCGARKLQPKKQVRAC